MAKLFSGLNLILGVLGFWTLLPLLDKPHSFVICNVWIIDERLEMYNLAGRTLGEDRNRIKKVDQKMLAYFHELLMNNNQTICCSRIIFRRKVINTIQNGDRSFTSSEFTIVNGSPFL